MGVDENELNAELQAEQETLLYKQRADQSRRKLRKIFGQHVHVDVSCSDIKKNGLIAILKSSIPLCYFLFTLLEDFSSENLFFWLEAEEFENAEFETPDDLRRCAQQIYNGYIKEDSMFEINITQKIRVPIQPAIDRADQLCFHNVKNYIYCLMEPHFYAFKRSPLFAQMKADIGDTSFYSKEARNNALKIILKNLDKTLPREDMIEDPLDTIQKSNDNIRAMVHVFIRKKLRIEFLDKAPPPPDVQNAAEMRKGKKVRLLDKRKK